ncbi:MAG: GntR family transcriptional regulator [Sphingomonadaceae bacterium]
MSKPALLVNYPDLGEKVYEAIRDRIVTCELAPGSPLPVVELARQFGVSLTPVRDALNRLAAEGLVEDVARKGYFVARLDPDEIADLLDARRLIELAAVEQGVYLLEADQLAEMRRLLAEMIQLFDEEGRCLDYAEFSKRDSQFHLLVVSSARNRHLLKIYRGLSVHVHIFRTNLAAQGGYRRSLASVREHRAILDAFEARDLQALKDALNQHVRGVVAEFAPARTGEAAESAER